jgi:hypothetical protein
MPYMLVGKWTVALQTRRRGSRNGRIFSVGLGEQGRRNKTGEFPHAIAQPRPRHMTKLWQSQNNPGPKFQATLGKPWLSRVED